VDLYTRLELTEAADTVAIRASYRRLAKRYHPDVSIAPDAHARFIAITEAYEILSDPVKRSRYDRVRSADSNVRTAKQQPWGAERKAKDDQRQAKAKAEHYSRMKYSQFDGEYFNSAFAYVAPKIMGCMGIAFVYLVVVLVLFIIINGLDLPSWVNIVPGLLVFLLLPGVAWFSMRFDDWHNQRQRQRRTRS
jgi:curved DNA-binding protein CbpA